jgi:hypothetical protein
MSFKQKEWLKPYIDHNTQKRKDACAQKNEFLKNFYKLMNNAVFGKTMENIRQRIRFELVHSKEQLTKLASKIYYKGHVIFGDDENSIVGVNMHKTRCLLNKPIYAGMAILDLSKTWMYNFHYNHILKKYNHENVKLLFTDTDSLCYNIFTEDIYKDMEKDKHLYDFSEYPKNHFLYDATNEKLVGKFKDETTSFPISEFVGLRSKMYSFTYVNNKTVEKKTAKGIKTYVIQKDVKFDDYKEAIINEKKYKQMSSMNTIRSKNHELFSMSINKVGLCCFDNKRYVLPNNIDTLAYGHKDIKK